MSIHLTHNAKHELAEQVSHQTASRPFSIHHTIVTPGLTPALYLHYHTELELFYLETGELRLFIEGTPYDLKTGDAMFIPQSLMHYAEQTSPTDSPCSFYALVFDKSMILDTLSSYYSRYINPVVYNGINCALHISSDTDWGKDIIDNLVPLFHIGSDKDISSYELELRGRLMMIWQQMYNNHFSEIQSNKLYDHMYSKFSKCIDYINENYSNDISLEELAESCKMSEGYFCRLFREFSGFTPFTYINRTRVLASCRLLTDTDLGISDIAIRCGYNNISYYNRTFRKIMHVTPSEYRRNQL